MGRTNDSLLDIVSGIVHFLYDVYRISPKLYKVKIALLRGKKTQTSHILCFGIEDTVRLR